MNITHRWFRAQMFVHGWHGHRDRDELVTFDQTMQRARKRYKTARLPGFEAEARERWEREERFLNHLAVAKRRG